jgi:hypothetical protein
MSNVIQFPSRVRFDEDPDYSIHVRITPEGFDWDIDEHTAGAISMDGVDGLIETARASGRYNAVAYVYHVMPWMLAAREYWLLGELGKPLHPEQSRRVGLQQSQAVHDFNANIHGLFGFANYLSLGVYDSVCVFGEVDGKYVWLYFHTSRAAISTSKTAPAKQETQSIFFLGGGSIPLA